MCKLHIIRYVLHALLYNHVLLSTDTAHFGHFFSVCLCLYYPHSSILSVSNPPLLSTQLFSLFVSFYLPSYYLPPPFSCIVSLCIVRSPFLVSSCIFTTFFYFLLIVSCSHSIFCLICCYFCT